MAEKPRLGQMTRKIRRTLNAHTASVTSWDAQGWTFDFTTAVPATPYRAWGFAVEGVAGSQPAPTTGRRRMMVIG